MSITLDATFRAAGGRIIAALAARFRDLDLAEEAFGEACARAAAAWESGPPADPAAWLYRTAQRAALDALRRREVRARLQPEAPESEPTTEEIMASDAAIMPDERLRLIFICCHPAVALEARAALTLRLVCGLSTAEIANAFLVPEPTMAQRLTRAKRKINAAGIPFGLPEPPQWPARLGAVLSTIEIAYSKAHEDAAGAGPHAGYGREMLGLAALLVALAPGEADVAALAATIHYAEARRPARIDADGAMVPLSDQDPARWDRAMIAAGDAFLAATPPGGARSIQAMIHSAWCRRIRLDEPAPWPEILALYDRLLAERDDVVVRLNRLVPLAEVEGPAAALAELEALGSLDAFGPWHALRADLLLRAGRPGAAEAYARAIALAPGPAERLWLERRLALARS